MTRREFVATSAAAFMAPSKRPVICIFSKHMAHQSYEQLGSMAKQLGYEGVDLTVRPKGHVLPERVAEDLPRAVEAIRAHKVAVPMITTDLKDASDPAARPTLAAMKKLGVPLYKPGYWRYEKGKPVEQTLRDVKPRFDSLVALNREYGVAAGLHNHSGDHFGCAVWDLRETLKGSNPDLAGYYLDPGHATIEGGLYGWRASLDLALPRLKMVAIKDFYWAKREGEWKLQWCPLGEGMVDWGAFFAEFAKSGFKGPLTLHVEYDPKDELAAIAQDLAFVRKQVESAYGAA
jgi:sugar phosphate isomerase/epimerase